MVGPSILKEIMKPNWNHWSGGDIKSKTYLKRGKEMFHNHNNFGLIQSKKS